MTTKTRLQKQLIGTKHGTKGSSIRDKLATLTRRRASTSAQQVSPSPISEPQNAVYVSGYALHSQPAHPQPDFGTVAPDFVVVERSEVPAGWTDDARYAMGGRVESQVVVMVDHGSVNRISLAAASNSTPNKTGSARSVMTGSSAQKASIRRKPPPKVSFEDVPDDEVEAEIVYIPLEAAVTPQEREKIEEYLRTSRLERDVKLSVRRQRSLPPLPMNANQENIPPSRQHPPRPPPKDRRDKRSLYSQTKGNLRVPEGQPAQRGLPTEMRLPPVPSPATAGGTVRDRWSSATSELPSRPPSPPVIMVVDEHGFARLPHSPTSPGPEWTPFLPPSKSPLGNSPLENVTHPHLQPDSFPPGAFPATASGSSREGNVEGSPMIVDDESNDSLYEYLHPSDISSASLNHAIEDLEMMTLDQMFRKAENGIKLAKMLRQKFRLLPQKQAIPDSLNSVRGLQRALTAMLNVFLRRKSIPEEHWDCRTGSWQLKYEERTGAYRRSIDRLLDIRSHLDSMPRSLRGKNLSKLCTWLDAHTRKYTSLAESINGLYDRLKVYYLHKQLEEAFRDEQEARAAHYQQRVSFYEQRIKAKMRRERLRNDFNAAMNAPRPSFLKFVA